MRQPRAPVVITGVVSACLDRVAGEPGAAALWRVWDEVVGDHIARRAQPIRLRGRTLVVAVSSAPWMQELQLLKPTIRAELNRRLPTALVEDLFFVLTEGRAATAPEPPSPPPARCPRPPRDVRLDALPAPLRASFDALLAAWRRRAGDA
jgi:hypothetical protein